MSEPTKEQMIVACSRSHGHGEDGAVIRGIQCGYDGLPADQAVCTIDYLLLSDTDEKKVDSVRRFIVGIELGQRLRKHGMDVVAPYYLRLVMEGK